MSEIAESEEADLAERWRQQWHERPDVVAFLEQFDRLTTEQIVAVK